MTRIRIIRTIRRMACAMAGLAGALLALSVTASAAFAYRLPPSGGGGATIPATRLPPGWSKHPPASALHVGAHTAVIGGMPGWQITLIAIASAVLAAALAVTVDRILAARRRVSATAT
jgi:hypothetical protein